MKHPASRLRDDGQRSIVKLFSGLFQRHSRWSVWSDFVMMAAIAISNTVDKSNAASREKTYRTISEKYTTQEQEAFSQAFTEVVEGMEANADQDFLGELFMALELGNDHNGQFFTPYGVCTMMARMTATGLLQRVERDGWISVNDPCCGAGALLLAFANECTRQKVNFQTSVLFVAQDIDLVSGCMCYIQMSLMGCPGYVVIANTITNPSTSYDSRGLIPKHVENVWYTPFYFKDEWHYRRLWVRLNMMIGGSTQAGNAAEPPSPPAMAETTFRETKRGQLAFF